MESTKLADIQLYLNLDTLEWRKDSPDIFDSGMPDGRILVSVIDIERGKLVSFIESFNPYNIDPKTIVVTVIPGADETAWANAHDALFLRLTGVEVKRPMMTVIQDEC